MLWPILESLLTPGPPSAEHVVEYPIILLSQRLTAVPCASGGIASCNERPCTCPYAVALSCHKTWLPSLQVYDKAVQRSGGIDVARLLAESQHPWWVDNYQFQFRGTQVRLATGCLLRLCSRVAHLGYCMPNAMAFSIMLSTLLLAASSLCTGPQAV
jgi:hypothetical protein